MFVSLVKLEKPNTKPKMRVQVEFGNIWNPIEVTNKIIICSSSVASYLVELNACIFCDLYLFYKFYLLHVLEMPFAAFLNSLFALCK